MIKTLQLTNEEKFHLESIYLKRENLKQQDQELANEWNNVISNFWNKNSIKQEDLKEPQINFSKGTVTFEYENKSTGKKTRTAKK